MVKYLTLFLLLITFTAFSQQAVVSGLVTDASDKGPLAGVNIIVNSAGTGATDENGRYSISINPGKHVIAFRFIGYDQEEIDIDAVAGVKYTYNLHLHPQMIQLSTAVISASKYEQHISDVTVSMEVIKPDFIESQGTRQLDEVLRLLPGVDVMDDQASIRGGSGYSYGAGSRVMLLVDGLPMLTGDVNDVKWNYIPIEMIGQVEVIKGASSALYGSSALNGVISVRTSTPSEFPETVVNLSGGFYNYPERKELSHWWDGVPFFGGIKMSHQRKEGPFDISLGMNVYGDEGYRTDNYQRYGRLTGGLRYSPAKVKGLSAGFHTSFHLQKTSDFLLWTDADSGAWVQDPVSVSPTNGTRFNIDPYITYFDKREGEHQLKTRYFMNRNDFPDDPDKQNGSDYYFGEYQYLKKFRNDMHLAAGTAASFTDGQSELYGDHTGTTLALFTQLDRRFFKRLSASLGLRWERYTLDDTDDESKPVLRAGVNYHAWKASYFRASFGQGYRYPSMAEKYTATSLGSLNIFPNPDLTPETGWSAEAGIRQGYRFGNWSGFIDLAGFWTEYQDMMEFTFGLYLPDSNTVPTLDHLGFKSLNIGAAKITGIDFSVNGQGQAGKAIFNYFAGYTYMNPIDLSADTLDDPILKYRYRHSAKGDIEILIKNYSAGLTITYQSFIERIDEAFEMEILGQEFFPGLEEYRNENDKGAIVVDLRAGWQFTPSSGISLIVKNVFNREYMGRPGDIQPPRNITVQYILKLK